MHPRRLPQDVAEVGGQQAHIRAAAETDTVQETSETPWPPTDTPALCPSPGVTTCCVSRARVTGALVGERCLTHMNIVIQARTNAI